MEKDKKTKNKKREVDGGRVDKNNRRRVKNLEPVVRNVKKAKRALQRRDKRMEPPDPHQKMIQLD